MANLHMLDKDNGKIKLLGQPVYTGFNLALNNLETAAGNGTKIKAKYYYQMMEHREQILSIRIQSASSITSQVIGNYFETIEDIQERTYTQIIKVLSNPNVPQAIRSFIKIIEKNMSYDKDAIKAINMKMTLFLILILSNLKSHITLLNPYKVTSYSLLNNTKKLNSPLF